MNRTTQIIMAISFYHDGLLTLREAITRLDDLKVRGEFNETGFVGYDYQTQQWIKATYAECPDMTFADTSAARH